jgi:hypothetical protein
LFARLSCQVNALPLNKLTFAELVDRTHQLKRLAIKTEPGWMNKIGDELVNRNHWDDFKLTKMVSVVTSFAKLEHSHPQLFARIADELSNAKTSLKDMYPQVLGELVAAYALFNIQSPRLMDKIAEEIRKRPSLDEFTELDLTRIKDAY